MPDFSWDDVREAIAQKFAAIPEVNSATKDNLDNWNGMVEAKVLPAQFELVDQPDSRTDIYRLTIPCSLLMPVPAGKSRQQPLASTIVRRAQVAWRVAFALGLHEDFPDQIVDSSSRIQSGAPDEEGAYAGEGCLEWSIVIVVEIVETLLVERTG